MSQEEAARAGSEFSLVAGGPLFQFALRIGLVGPRMAPVAPRIIVAMLLTWAPPLVLSLIDRRAYAGVQVPFLFDYAAQARFLAALPLLFAAEGVVHERIGPMIPQFESRGLIPDEERPRFRALVASVVRWRNSGAAEILQLLLAFFALRLVFTRTVLQTDTWHAVSAGGALRLTKAGFWYTWVSMPILEFLLLRWLYRWGLWTAFLWRVSRSPMRLIPTHPDCAGGLGFLSRSAIGIGPVLMAMSVIVSGVVASKIQYDGASLGAFKFEIGALVVLLVAIALGPLCLFMPRLMAMKLKGELDYGALASDYVAAFDDKWNRARAPSPETWLGSPDIQSLADIGNGYSVINRIQAAPFQRDMVVLSVAYALIPQLPLVLFIIPLNELILKLFKLIF